MLFGGEYQFWRTPSPSRWPIVLREMRAAGLNTVTVGVSWQYHSPAPGVYDFSGIRDLGRFLDDAAAAGLYVIARPGPAYNAEASASNLPGWLLSRVGPLRGNAGHAYCGAAAYSPGYAAAYRDWYRHVLPIIASRQFTGGRGTVIAMQIENEYSPHCGDPGYMMALHDLAHHLGIVVPLLANNNTCCAPAGSWHIRGDDGRPIVDIPAEDDYPCVATCGPNWNGRIFHTIDGLEARLRTAGVTQAPVALAELQGGYFTGWGGTSYTTMSRALGPSFAEVLDGSALGQGATLISIYMVAGGTSWGYLAGPDTITSYDYDAAIHEWGDLSDTYDSLKRTGMFVQAFGDALAATNRIDSVTASNASLLYSVRETVDGAQRGTHLIVLRNTDTRRWSETKLHLRLNGRYETVPRAGGPIRVPPHALYLLLSNYVLGPGVRLQYSTSRPLTQARIHADEIAVFYGVPGTPGETSLAFAHLPKVLRVDPGISVHYDPALGALRLDYRHQERPRYVVLSSGGHRLVLVLTGPLGAARTWRLDLPAGTVLVMGPRMVVATADAHHTLHLDVTAGGDFPLAVWAPGGARAMTEPGAEGPRIASNVRRSIVHGSVNGRRPLRVHFDAMLDGSTGSMIAGRPVITLPALKTWRFMLESPESTTQFDDRGWISAVEATTLNPNVPAGDTLLADDYGYHYGFVWYRGRFRGSGAERALRLYARNSYSVWLNGTYLGSSTIHNDLKNVNDQVVAADGEPRNSTYADGLTYRIPRGQVRAGETNTIAVLVESLGHNTGFANGERARSPFGILSARLVSSRGTDTIHWKIQGGEATQPDGVDSPLNASGLYGERHGWYRSNFDDTLWLPVTVPDDWAARGLHFQGVGWYRTSFTLQLPAGVDAPLGLVIPHAQDKVAIWINGLLIGHYWDGVGPQHMFYLPAGLLNEHGRNTLALAVWNRGHHGGLTGGVYLRPFDVTARVGLNDIAP